jgi:hypothetical protein
MFHELIEILIVAFTALATGYMVGMTRGKKAYQRGYDTAWVDRQIFNARLRNKKIRRSPNGQFTNVK